MIKNYLISSLFLLLYSTAFGQVVQFDYNKRLTYASTINTDTIAVFYRSDGGAPLITSQYTKGFGKDYHSSIQWLYNYKGKTYALDGEVLNQRYIASNGFKEKDPDGPPNYFELAENLWSVGDYTDCRLYVHRNEDNSQMRLFAYNRQDAYDYTNICNALLHTYGIPPVQLEKGWVIVTGDLYLNEEKNYPLLGTLLPDDASFRQSIIINQREIDLDLGGTTEQRVDFMNTMPYPSYTEFIGWHHQLDEVTTEYAETFFGRMGRYFNLFGRYDIKGFQAYYLGEADFLRKHYTEHRQLTVDQAELLYKEIMAHQTENLAENLVR